MSTPATELQKLLELRDAGEVTQAEFEVAKRRVLHPERTAPPAPSQDGIWRGFVGWTVAMGALIGGTTLLAMTEAGALAISALVLLALAILFVTLWANQ